MEATFLGDVESKLSRLPSGYDPDLLGGNRWTYETLRSPFVDKKGIVAQCVTQILNETEGRFDQVDPLFINIKGEVNVLPNGISLPTNIGGYELNPIAKPMPYEYETNTNRVGRQTYLQAEKMADGSSLFGLAAASCSDTKSRLATYTIAVRTIFGAVSQMPDEELNAKIALVFFEGYGQHPTVGDVIGNVHGKTKEFPFNPKQGQDVIKTWKRYARDLSTVMDGRMDESGLWIDGSERVMDAAEIMSHIFNVEELFKLIGEKTVNVTSFIQKIVDESRKNDTVEGAKGFAYQTEEQLIAYQRRLKRGEKATTIAIPGVGVMGALNISSSEIIWKKTKSSDGKKIIITSQAFEGLGGCQIYFQSEYWDYGSPNYNPVAERTAGLRATATVKFSDQFQDQIRQMPDYLHRYQKPIQARSW